MTPPARYLLVLAFAALLAVAIAVLVDGERPVRTSLSVVDALSAETAEFSADYARALEERTFRFPEDHGPHPDYRTEWWYYTGNLSDPSGRRFGYQLTIFRTALRPADESTDSTWSTRQLYMAHFALSDAQADAFHAFERFSRGAAGLAGAIDRPYRVWLEDWSVVGATADSVHLQASEEGLSIDLTLHRVKPIVLQGDDGLDQKGPEAGNASYYYSMTRMRTAGTVVIGRERHDVEGLSWLDREWSTSALADDQVGWDWFSLQLDDGRDVMFYRLRRRDGTASPFSNGVVVDTDGSIRRLDHRDVELEPSRFWKSPQTDRRYPIDWSFRIPSMDVDLDLVPYVEHQELDLAVRYWEGAVRVEGSHEGSGFVEMTGYGDSNSGEEANAPARGDAAGDDTARLGDDTARLGDDTPERGGETPEPGGETAGPGGETAGPGGDASGRGGEAAHSGTHAAAGLRGL